MIILDRTPRELDSNDASAERPTARRVKTITRRQPTGGPWVSLLRAAEYLSEPAESLRKKIERAARGSSEANMNGLQAKKFGRLWKVHLGDWQR